MTEKEKVMVILGPTSTGKTDLSIKLAQKHNGEIISADSRQIYKELNLLSGKVTPNEKGNIPHHMLDIVSVEKDYSVAEYKKEAQQNIYKILDRGKLPIVAGGTGFYIDSVIFDIDFPEVEPDWNLRDRLEIKTENELFDILKQIDPKRAENIDQNNKVRLIRAIEIAKKLGKNPPPPDYSSSKYDTLFIGLDLPDNDLKKRIKMRIEKRIKEGMIFETKKIIDSGVNKDRLINLGLDAKYSTLLALGEIEENEMIEELTKETWQYVKRQRTWWKRNKDIEWFNPITDKEKIERTVKDFLLK